MRSCFIKAIQKAKHSIYLYIYSLNDPEILAILRKQQKEGLEIKIFIDEKNIKELNIDGPFVIPKVKKTGLMHQKILVVDKESVWIGSANFTSTSLRTHDNLIVALYAPEIAESVIHEQGGVFTVANQKIEMFILPKERKEAFARVVNLIETSKKNLEIAMFTWTHADLTRKVIEAQKRDVKVRAVLDQTSSKGVSKKSLETLASSGISIKVNTGSPLLHHKFAYIDQKTLIMGSCNWTKAAFSKNDECILIINDLTCSQRKKIDKLCHALRATSRI